ncbi:MAG: response regulator [Terriglobales bacterium]
MTAVLLIDDNPVQLRAREAVLRNAGFATHIATTQESALALLRGQGADGIGAIITDHIMPGSSGAEFVRALRTAKPGVPVIVITGLAEAESDYRGAGVTFRQKPCPPEELIALVRSSVAGATG